MEKIRPQGVFLVGIMTVLIALEMGLFALIIFGLGEAGGRGSAELGVIEALLCGGFGVSFLVDALLIFRAKQTGYFLSMALWILLFSAVICGYVYYGLFYGLTTAGAPFFLYPILYPIVCLVYFLKKSVRMYFGT